LDNKDDRPSGVLPPGFSAGPALHDQAEPNAKGAYPPGVEPAEAPKQAQFPKGMEPAEAPSKLPVTGTIQGPVRPTGPIADPNAPKPDAKTEPEVVTVKYRGPVSLAPFKCDAITRSSFIERVCYDASNSYMLIDLNGAWYHYCEIDAGTVSNLMAADSMGRFYNQSIKGRFDCRTHRVPHY